MTADADILLRMLEPAVRPTGAPAPPKAGAKVAGTPIEQRDFDALLAEASAENAGDVNDAPSTAKVKDQPLAGLSGFDAIENASLRALRDDPGRNR